MRGARAALAAAAAAVLITACGSSSPAKPKASKSSMANISAVGATGSVTDPVITIEGRGFGNRPAPDPSYPPEGKSGCPPAPIAGDGRLFGTALHLATLDARHGSYRQWNAGEYTTGGSGQFDCVGFLIKSWTPTKVVFSFGNLYGKLIPQNTYFLSNKDHFKVWVKGASAEGAARLNGVPKAGKPTQ